MVRTDSPDGRADRNCRPKLTSPEKSTRLDHREASGQVDDPAIERGQFVSRASRQHARELQFCLQICDRATNLVRSRALSACREACTSGDKFRQAWTFF